MFYKVIFNDNVVDVLDSLVYLKYQKKYDRMIFCDVNEAQAIFSSNGKHIWHVKGLYHVPVPGYDTVELEEIDEQEYKRLKVFNGDTPEMVVDRFIKLVFVNKEVDQLVESLKRLYMHQEIDADNVMELCKRFSITEDEMETILGENKVENFEV